MDSSHKIESDALKPDVDKKHSGSKGRSETAEKVPEVQQRSTKSAAGSSSSKISSSIAGPAETQESMTFAVNELSGPVVAGLHSSEENNPTEEFTAQFSFYENESKNASEIEDQTRLIIEKSKPPQEENLAKIIPDPVASLVNQGWKSFIQSMQKGENPLLTVYKDEPHKSPGEQGKEKKSSDALSRQTFTPNFAGPGGGGGRIPKRVPLQELPQNLASFGKPQKQQQTHQATTMTEEDKENYRSRFSISSYNTKASTLPSFHDFLKAHKTRTGNVMSRLEGSARSNKPESEASSSVANEEQRKLTSVRNSGGLSSASVVVNQQSPLDLIHGNYSGVKAMPLPYSPGSNPQRKSFTTATTDISYQSGKSSLNESSLLLNELPVIMEYPEITQLIGKKSSRKSSTKGNLESNASDVSEEFTDEDEDMESHSEFCSTCDFENETQYEEGEECGESDFDEEENASIILLNKTEKKGYPQEQGSQNLSGRRKQSGNYEEILFQEDDDSDTIPQTGYIQKKSGDADLMGSLQQKKFPISKILTRQELIQTNPEEEEEIEDEEYEDDDDDEEGEEYYTTDDEDEVGESSEIQEIERDKFQEKNVIKKLDFKEDQMEENISEPYQSKIEKGEKMDIISLGTNSGQKQKPEVTKNDVENLTTVFNSLEDEIWDIQAQEKIFEKNVRVFQASMRAADEWLDHLFALAEDKPEAKETLSLTSSELNKIFGEDP